MSLHVTVDMTETDSGESPSNGREANIFLINKFRLIPVAVLELHFTISTVKLTDQYIKLKKTITLLLRNLNKNSREQLLLREYARKTSFS